MEKKEIFKYLIKEFHETALPELYNRDLVIPDTKKIVTIAGSRRAGKTFYFYQLMTELIEKIGKDRIVYINFEDDRILPMNFKELYNINEAYYELYPQNKDKGIYLFFDEIQNVDSWELYIRRIYDKELVRIFITGSNSKLLSKEIATSLRGRTLNFDIFPLSFKEFLRFNSVAFNKDIAYSKKRFDIKNKFEKYLSLGGFPEVALEKNNLEHDILNSYYEMVIYRDLAERFNIRNIGLLKVLTKFLLTNLSNMFSVNSYYNTLKETSSVGKETVFEYLSYLEYANVIFLVPLFDYSLKKQQVNPRKIYCIDNGLRNAVSFKFSGDEGRLAENLVFVELKRRKKEIYYWKNKGEVDFIIKSDEQDLTAINVAYTDEINKRETNSLLEFKKKFNKAKKLIVLTKDTEKKENNIKFIPLWKWLLNNSN